MSSCRLPINQTNKKGLGGALAMTASVPLTSRRLPEGLSRPARRGSLSRDPTIAATLS